MTTEQVLRTLTDLELQERATELGFDPYGPRATLIAKIEGATASAHHGSVANGTATSETPNNAGKPKKDDKDAKKKAKKRRRKKRVVAPSRDAAAGSQEDTTNGNGDEEYDDEDIGQIDIEYVPEALELDPAYSVFANVFAKFHALAPKIENDGLAEPNAEQLDHQQAPMDADDTDATKSSDEDDDEEGGQEDGNNPLSKKRLKKLMRLSVAELKRLARKPEVVEVRCLGPSDLVLGKILTNVNI